MDTLTKQQRSELMAKVRARGNKSTELRFVKLLRKWRLHGWRRSQRLAGQPDFVFMQAKVAVFIDGCFWHGCKLHCRMPAANRSYWLKKVSRNKSRDRLVTLTLKRAGWRVIRIWEHELACKNEARLVKRIQRALDVTSDKWQAVVKVLRCLCCFAAIPFRVFPAFVWLRRGMRVVRDSISAPLRLCVKICVHPCPSVVDFLAQKKSNNQQN